MENGQNYRNDDPRKARGWEIVRELNNRVPDMGALAARKLLAEYMKLGVAGAGKLHSAILSAAVRMAMVFPEFHFVPFLDIWGMENLRPEDGEAWVDESGKRFPSLVEKVAKAYAYSMLFHGDEHLASELEETLLSLLKKKGYRMWLQNGMLTLTTQVLATRVFTAEVKRRRMTFVQLLLPDGTEMVTEVHTLTVFQRMRYEEIEGRLFEAVVRSADSGKLRIEAAILSAGTGRCAFGTAVGYIDRIDMGHHHIHIFDNFSRHLVAKFASTCPGPGQYVEFIPIIPKEGNFKTAVILRVLDNGAEAFGRRNVVVTYTNDGQGYVAWELLPETDGHVSPITEKGADTEPATKGYISRQLADRLAKPLPRKGDRLSVVVFLKRGKDGRKRPCVVEY